MYLQTVTHTCSGDATHTPLCLQYVLHTIWCRSMIYLCPVLTVLEFDPDTDHEQTMSRGFKLGKCWGALFDFSQVLANPTSLASAKSAYYCLQPLRDFQAMEVWDGVGGSAQSAMWTKAKD